MLDGQLKRSGFDLLRKPFFHWDLVFIFQRGFYQREMFLAELPEIRRFGVFASARIRNVENVFDLHGLCGIIQQANARRSTADIAAHARVPDVIIRDGSCLGTLCVDQKLVRERILVQPSCCTEKSCPFPDVPGDLPCCLLGQIQEIIYFCSHDALLSILENANRAGSAEGTGPVWINVITTGNPRPDRARRTRNR